jgi:hypothetical protein
MRRDTDRIAGSRARPAPPRACCDGWRNVDGPRQIG